jgi:HAD superfamily hydrolase (TIGR01509 family)
MRDCPANLGAWDTWWLATSDTGNGPSVPTQDPRVSGFELVIFDCDGVLVDSDRLAVRVDARVITEAGWPITEAEVIERFLGRSDTDQIAEIESHLGRALPSDWLEQCEHLYREVFETELRAVEGVPELLASLDLPNCVASSGSQEKMRYTLSKTGLYSFFQGRIFSVSEVTRGKPAPDLFLYAAARMNTDPARCAVVEDSSVGVAAARAAGMWAFGYAGGISDPARLEGPRTTIFGHMRDLIPLLHGPTTGRPVVEGQ